MTQIIEFTKHSDNYLVYHFDFECNDTSAIGTYTGNCSLNKFMNLNDWHTILGDLSAPVGKYVENPFRQPTDAVRQIDGTNFELHIHWEDMDASLYSKLLSSLDFDLVFPFVIKVRVVLRSNVDKFMIPDTPAKSPVRKKTAERKKTTDTSAHSLNVSKLTNGNDSGQSIKLRECCVRLPLLQFDENGDLIQNHMVRNKRKHSSIAANEVQPTKITPSKIHSDQNDLFMCSSSSTPLARNHSVALKEIENEVRETFAIPDPKVAKRVTNRLTTTPRSSNDRKSSQFNPRIRLLKPPDDVNRLNKSKKLKQKNTGKKTGKSKTKDKTTKKPKPKAQSVANESEWFEKPAENQKVKKVKPKKKSSPPAAPEIIKLEERDLKSLTDDELWKSFDDHYAVVSNLFLDYLKQTDATVRKSDDYNHIDMLSLVTTDQFSVMLDILFDKFVKIGEFGEICYDTLFLELLIPEWTLAIYMQRHSLDRAVAIERINAQKTDDNQSYEGYTTIVSVKLDDTMNNTKTHTTIDKI
ncbi:uncharacterized protein LOC129576367 [Sitodiplosis mosellana]|uniref:uncharacterized protein LOC129576367 n=1 Tax=Sitodiplosis mosellana TaxID=263140 RepID=UPI002444C215|nr:uncharacterized protein LOC129576367 [Sitodiplosis mosellana]